MVNPLNYLTISSWTPAASRLSNEQFAFFLYIHSDRRLKWIIACNVVDVTFNSFFFLFYDTENSFFEIFTGQSLAVTILICVQSVKNVRKVFIVFSIHSRSFTWHVRIVSFELPKIHERNSNLKQHSIKNINNYWTPLLLMRLILNNNILHVITSSIYSWHQSSIFLSINTPCHGNSSIAVYFTLLIVSWNKCSITKPLLAYQNNVLRS